MDSRKYEDFLSITHFKIGELPCGLLLELAWGNFKAEIINTTIETVEKVQICHLCELCAL